jgi:hypothetical protein
MVYHLKGRMQGVTISVPSMVYHLKGRMQGVTISGNVMIYYKTYVENVMMQNGRICHLNAVLGWLKNINRVKKCILDPKLNHIQNKKRGCNQPIAPL